MADKRDAGVRSVIGRERAVGKAATRKHSKVEHSKQNSDEWACFVSLNIAGKGRCACFEATHKTLGILASTK